MVEKGAWQTFRIDEHPDFRAMPRDRCSVVMLQGPTPGAVQPVLGDELVLGRDEELPSRIDDRGMSRRHARIYRVLGQWAIEDLGSTNGTRVNGELVRSPKPLADGDRVQVGETTVLRVALQDAREQEVAQQTYESTVRDPLTGAYNRRHLEERLVAELAFAQRHATSLSVAFVDLDRFKQLNDTRGHLAGDAALVQAAAAMLECVRTEDVVARFGGEEFVVLARAIGAEGAARLGERLRAKLEMLEVRFEATTFRLTASVGHATLDAEHPYRHPEEILAAADRAVYAAKQAGRNCVVAA